MPESIVALRVARSVEGLARRLREVREEGRAATTTAFEQGVGPATITAPAAVEPLVGGLEDVLSAGGAGGASVAGEQRSPPSPQRPRFRDVTGRYVSEDAPGIKFFLTLEDKRRLRRLGFSEDSMSRMTPDEAADILRRDAGFIGPPEPEPQTLWAVGQQEMEERENVPPPPPRPRERTPGSVAEIDERRLKHKQLTDEQIDEDRRKAISKEAYEATDQEVLRSITNHRNALEYLNREVKTAGAEQERLTELSKKGKDVTDDLARAEQTHSYALQERRDKQQELSLWERERRDRGLQFAVGGLGQQMAGGFLGCMGIGGGSPIGTALGAVLWGANPYVAAATLAGMGLGYATSLSGQAVDEQRATYETGMMLGSFDDVRGRAQRLRGPWLLPYLEEQGAVRAYASSTGRDDIEGLVGFTRAYGLNLNDQASLMSRFARMGRLPSARGEFAEGYWRDLQGPPAPSRLPGEQPGGEPEISGWTYFKNFVLGSGGGWDATVPTPGKLTPEQLPTDSGPLRAWVPGFDTRTGDLPAMLASAFERSRYMGVGGEGRHALIRSFEEQAARLAEVQGAGGGPILDRDMGFGANLLAEASQLYPAGTSPDIAAAPAAAAIQTAESPTNRTARGLQIRSIRQLGMQNEPLRQAILQARGWDITEYTGARAAMENMFSLGDIAGGDEVARAGLGAITHITGTDTAMARQYWAAGRPGAVGIAAERLSRQLLATEPGSGAGAKTMEEFRQLYEQKQAAAGAEVTPAKQEIEEEQIAATTRGIKLLGQSIRQGVLDFLADITHAREEWEKHVAPSPHVHQGSPAAQ